MKYYYNIYYLNNKINKRPLSEEDITSVISNNDIIKKRNSITNELEVIPTSKLKIIKCTVI